MVAAGIAAAALAVAPAYAQQDSAGWSVANPGADIAIYPGGPALVREALDFRLPNGEGRIAWIGPPSGLDLSSLSLRFPELPGVGVLEQRSLPGTAGLQTLLKASRGREVALLLASGDTLRATLLSTSGGLLLREREGSIVGLAPGQVRALLLPDLPHGTRLLPAIRWTVRSPRPGPARGRVRYLTVGLTWSAEYALTVDPSGKSLEMEAWADLHDGSGRSWPDARVRLIAGELNRAGAAATVGQLAGARAMEAAAPASDQAQERSFSEYHVFELPRRVSLEGGQTSRSLLLRASKVPVRRLYLLRGGEAYPYGSSRPILQSEPGGISGRTAVQAVLELGSGKGTPIDRPLPAGRARIYEADEDGSVLLAGEAPMPDLMVGDTVRLPLGRAFDLTAERIRTDFRRPDTYSLEESYRITLRSAKKEPVEVRVTERMFRWREWKITAESVDGKPARHAKPDAEHAEWRVTVPADGRATLEYTVHYSWSEKDLR
jgi:hypothetical protein